MLVSPDRATRASTRTAAVCVEPRVGPRYRGAADPVDAVTLLIIPLALLAVVVGVAFGWRFVFAPLLGIAIFSWATATLRSMVNDGRAHVEADEQQPRPVSADERVLYWCEECGTELLLVVRGSGAQPRHCAMKMHERAELLSN